MSDKRTLRGRWLRALLLVILWWPMAHSGRIHAQIRVEPPTWWVGMHNPSVQLLFHGNGLASATPTVEYPGVTLEAWHAGTSPNYLFVDVRIAPDAEPGMLTFRLERPGAPVETIAYPLLKREQPASAYKGFTPADAMYLITPDRFANGDPTNDAFPQMRESLPDRSDDYGRHGGDIRGMIQHLDYLEDMGFTALWSSPLLTNDMPEASYHGYAITDYYQVDPRFGTLEEYKQLSREAQARGIKLIMDQVVNHCGRYHWWMEDLPFSDWVHYQSDWEAEKPTTVTNHRRTVNQDPYAAASDRRQMNQGWFVPSMPDLNQANPFLARYLIQNSIWWIETLQLGGIRQDTYPYPDKDFMADWARSIMEEYPDFSIVGEEWSYNPLLVGYWQDGSPNRDGYRSYLKSPMDFPLQRTLVQALNAPEGWDSGLNTLYEGLANDFHYPNPKDLLFFGDNHDMDRLFTQVGESEARMEMALAFILTAPRIPQVYYGTEVLMQNSDKPGDHGRIRGEFPGGWPDAKKNAFTGKGLTAAEKRMQEKTRNLLRFRKGSPALAQGRTLHFAPENGIYLMARLHEDQVVITLLNKNPGPVTLPLGRFSELGLEGRKLADVLTGGEWVWSESLSLKAMGALVLTPIE